MARVITEAPMATACKNGTSLHVRDPKRQPMKGEKIKINPI